MDENFDTRRQLFGDEVLGDVNLRMIRCARSVGGTRPAPHSNSLLRSLVILS
jgi:hypothetical protein